MRQPVCFVILVAVLVFSSAACSQLKPTKMSAASEAAVVGPADTGIDPVAEQATIAVVLGGLAAALKRRKSGKRQSR